MATKRSKEPVTKPERLDIEAFLAGRLRLRRAPEFREDAMWLVAEVEYASDDDKVGEIHLVLRIKDLFQALDDLFTARRR